MRTIHRLDRATSGVLILVKNFAKTQEMSQRVANHDLRKEYVCRVLGEFPVSAAEVVKTAEAKADSVSDVVDGENSIPSILVDAPLLTVSQKIGLNRVDSRGKESQTTFHRLSFNGVSSVVKCIPKTGRTHQIRVSFVANSPIRQSTTRRFNKNNPQIRKFSKIIQSINKSEN